MSNKQTEVLHGDLATGYVPTNTGDPRPTPWQRDIEELIECSKAAEALEEFVSHAAYGIALSLILWG